MGRPRKTGPNEILDVNLEDAAESPEAETLTQEEAPATDSYAYTVVRVNDMYQFVRIPFNKRTQAVGAPELVAESTDRYEIESKFAVELDYQIFYLEQFEK